MITRMTAIAWLAGCLLLAAETTLENRFATAGDNAGELSGFVEAAAVEFGAFGGKAAVFLVENMPPNDLRTLKQDFLMENLELAMKARSGFPWSKDIPDDVFLNDVLPYASLDETRESWRPEFHRQCGKLVSRCTTATEAAQALNKGFFDIIGVHYDTGRKAPNQSPSESKELGKATCTGLSIIMVNACRSVGVPARMVGTAQWSNKRGNHTWVEIHDRGEWFFTGADEYDETGLNRAWFTGDASKAIADDWKHAIWATSWRKADAHFPMVWNPGDRSVPAVNVTSRYAREGDTGPSEVIVHLRLWDKSGGERLARPVDLLDSSGKKLTTVTTRGGTADLNDMPSVRVKSGTRYRLRVEKDGEQREEALVPPASGESTRELVWDEMGGRADHLKAVGEWLALPPEERHSSVPDHMLSKTEAATATRMIWQTYRKELAGRRRGELETKMVETAGKRMQYHEKSFGEAAEGERSLWISMHGGGGAPARVNDSQWHNQIRLYEPEEGIVVAPRAPTDTWNLWHQGHIDDLFDRLIANFVAGRGVNPDRIYLLGYSAGGDGVYQLAPRMADRFAAAAMMAGHPNDASPLGLRNLPFMIFMGGNDGAYDRNRIAAEWGRQLAKLRQDDGGYKHKVTIYEGLGHWMEGKDREALPWMAARTRNPWPRKLIWHQSGRTHDRFYWLSVPAGTAKRGQTVRAEVDGQEIRLEAEGLHRITLRLNDALVDLDQPVVVTVNGEKKFESMIDRKVRPIWDSLNERADPRSAASATIDIEF